MKYINKTEGGGKKIPYDRGGAGDGWSLRVEKPSRRAKKKRGPKNADKNHGIQNLSEPGPSRAKNGITIRADPQGSTSDVVLGKTIEGVEERGGNWIPTGIETYKGGAIRRRVMGHKMSSWKEDSNLDTEAEEKRKPKSRETAKKKKRLASENRVSAPNQRTKSAQVH